MSEVGGELRGVNKVKERLERDGEERRGDDKLSGLLITSFNPDDTVPMREEGVVSVDCPVEAVDDHIILVREKSQKTLGLLHMTDRTGEKSRPFIGVIRSVGPSAPVSLTVNQRIIYQEYGQTVIHPFGIEYVAIRSRDVICTFKEDWNGQRTE